ncbi:MAG TPA: R3H domain-containing nucleic acid-binding protein [Polyangiaceae bacterium]|nr:R3H domain-containing nucleic acid-binding protein [Polyangiaceae bacterium]
MDNEEETRDEDWEAGDDTVDEAADTEQGDDGPEIVPADERTKQALEFVTNVVREMELNCKVRLRRPREGDSPDEINIEIQGPDAGLAIGKKGQVLQALQFLTHRVVNRPTLDKRHVLVDAEGYRSRRDDSLASMAKRLGRQAVHEGKIITFEPMNPRDRRVVHMALAKFEGVITKSDGEGEDRRVQIIPVRRPSPAAETSGQN